MDGWMDSPIPFCAEAHLRHYRETDYGDGWRRGRGRGERGKGMQLPVAGRRWGEILLPVMVYVTVFSESVLSFTHPPLALSMYDPGQYVPHGCTLHNSGPTVTPTVTYAFVFFFQMRKGPPAGWSEPVRGFRFGGVFCFEPGESKIPFTIAIYRHCAATPHCHATAHGGGAIIELISSHSDQVLRWRGPVMRSYHHKFYFYH